MINIAYLILQQTYTYRADLKGWNQKPQAQKIWVNFKTDFCTAQKELCRTGKLAVEDSVNHTELVNMVSEGIQQALQQGPSPHQNTANIPRLDHQPYTGCAIYWLMVTPV
eukprot:9956207-Ditylum_brightwellii.AAC.1